MSQIDVYEKDKTAPVSKYVYIWDNDKLIARQIISYDPQDNGLIMTSRIIYDAEDEPQGFILLGEQNGESTGQQVFLYRKNLQGDITGIIDSLSGQMLVEYAYDAYGNAQLIVNGSDIGTVVVAALATAYTPLLYRGYVYTNLGGEYAYYLGSRFYVPQLGRFLNADKHTDTGTGVIGTNMYAYCNNNPVMYVDPTGESYAETQTQNQPLGLIEWFLAVYIAILTVLALPRTTVNIQPAINISTAEKSSTKTKTLADTKAKKPLFKVYQLAYINDKDELIKLPTKYSFVEALELLGITGAKNSLSQKFKYNRGYSSDAQRITESYGADQWGIYTNNQSYAKALASVMSGTEAPEVHGSGRYGHYHDYTHTFHVWYGGKISY